MSDKGVVIVAGGTGTRMKVKKAKQFLELGGVPILIRTFEAFLRYDPAISIVLVLYKDLLQEWKDIQKRHNFSAPHTIVFGGEERFHSVKVGLDALGPEVKHVAIHDAVRPFVEVNTIDRCFNAAEEHGAAIPGIPVVDTIRKILGTESSTLSRDELVAVQTPQCFDVPLIRKAYQTTFKTSFTDDASVAEAAGFPIRIVEGNRKNIKITTPEDLLIGEAFLNSGT